MGYVLFLGFKNVFRQPLRTTLALAGIALSISMVIVGTSMIRGAEQTVFQEALGELGEIVVARQDYFERSRFNPLKYSLRGSAELRDHFLGVEGVRAAVERIDFGFLAEHGERSAAFGCRAVNVEQFARFSTVPERLVAGRYLQPGAKELLVGKWVADELGVEPGESVTVIGRTVYDSFMADDYEIAGVFDLGSKMANRSALMPLGPAQEFLEMPDAVSKILLYAEDYRDVDDIVERVRSEPLPAEGIALRPWTEDAMLGGMYLVMNSAGKIIAAIICFVAGLGIFNMMMVTVLERRKEMGVLMALGMSRSAVLLSFVGETVLYGLVGGAAGAVLGTPLALYLDRYGINLQTDKIEGLPVAVSNTIHADFGPESVLTGLLLGVLLSVFGALGPILKTLNMGPQDAMTR